MIKIKILTKDYLMKKYVENKKSSLQIAKDLDCNKTTILNYLKKYNIKRRNIDKYSKILIKKVLIQEYIKNTKSIYKLAKEWKCGATTIIRYLNKYNIKIRTISKSIKGKNHWNYGKTGKDCPNFKGKKTVRGYVLLYVPTHPYVTSIGYVREHRLVIETYLGRYLKPEEIVHHINRKRNDNRLKNLYLFKNKQSHTAYETLKREYPNLIKNLKSNLRDIKCISNK